MKFKNIVFVLGLTLMLCMMLLGWCSCTTTKKGTKTSEKIDSSRLENLVDSIRLLTLENEKLQSELRESIYSGVQFEEEGPYSTKPCDSTKIEPNKVTIRPDGSIEATGRIKSAYSTIDKLTKTIKELYRINDSLRLVKQQVKTETKYVKDTKEKEVKRELFPWYLLVIAGAAAVFIWLIKKSQK